MPASLCSQHSLSALAQLHGQQCKHTMIVCCHCFPPHHMHYELTCALVNICYSFKAKQRSCILILCCCSHMLLAHCIQARHRATSWHLDHLIAVPPVRCRFTRLMTGSPTKAQQTKLQGLYMYGGVGVGKTMLMDLLAHSAPSSFQVCAPSPTSS